MITISLKNARDIAVIIDAVNMRAEGVPIVGPDGHIVLEASQTKEEIPIADLDPRPASRSFAMNSLRGPHQRWWRNGMRKVGVVE